MKCNCCGEEISQVLIRKFFADGSDSNELADIDDLGDGCYGIDTDQNWTGYILDEDDKDVYNTILCPKCNEFPFMDKEIHQQEIVQLTLWNEQEPCEDNEAIKALEQEPCEDCVSRNAIRLKVAEMPKYTDGKKLASIRHLKEFLEKEYPLEESIEVTPDICTGFTIALECIGRFIKSLPSTPTHKALKWAGDKACPICPKCNCNIIEEYISCSDYAEMYKHMKYCPNCGERIESEKDEWIKRN